MIQIRDEDSGDSGHQEKIKIWQKWKQLTKVSRELMQVWELIGLSNELPHLTHGKVCGEFQESLLVYIQSNYNWGGDLRPLIQDVKNPKIKFEKQKPLYDVEEGTLKEKEQTKTWEMKWRLYMNRLETMEENVEKMFGLLMGQCTQALIDKVKASPEYAIKADNSDALWLLQKIKVLSAGVDNQVNKILTYHE